MDELVVVAQGPLPRVKELLRELTSAGVGAQVLGPADGCVNR